MSERLDFADKSNIPNCSFRIEVVGLALFGLSLLVIIAIIVLIIIGVILLGFILHTIIHWFPAVIAAVIVYLLTHNLLYAAIGFVVVALIMVAIRRR